MDAIVAVLKHAKETPRTQRYDEVKVGSQPTSTLYVRKGWGLDSGIEWIKVTIEECDEPEEV